MARPVTCLRALSWASASLTPPSIFALARTDCSAMGSLGGGANHACLGRGLGGLVKELQQQVLGDQAAIGLARPHVRDGCVILAQRHLALDDGLPRPGLAGKRHLAMPRALGRWRHAPEADADVADLAVFQFQVEGTEGGRDVLVETLGDLVAMEQARGI